MAVGKNKRLSKGGKKGSKKKIVDPFSRKEWYVVKSPAMFKNRSVGQTIVNRTQGTRIASEGLKGRVFEIVQADLNGDDVGHRKFKLIAEEIQGKDVLTNFYGMDITRDKLCSIVRKWQSTIEAVVDVKTTDQFMLRIFCIGFCQKRDNSKRKTAYAYRSQIRLIRQRMNEIVQREVAQCDLKEVVNKLLPDSIAQDIKKRCDSVYPLHDVMIRKVKVMKRPKLDIGKLLELHETSKTGAGETTVDANTGEVVARPDGYEPPVVAAV